jgi:large subunit ribosomal protein L32
MALPKTRYAHARQGERRAHLAIKRIQLVECSQCHQPKRPHFVCDFCGTYDGRQVIAPRDERDHAGHNHE